MGDYLSKSGDITNEKQPELKPGDTKEVLLANDKMMGDFYRSQLDKLKKLDVPARASKTQAALVEMYERLAKMSDDHSAAVNAGDPKAGDKLNEEAQKISKECQPKIEKEIGDLTKSLGGPK